jgi:hypothetical protein
VTLLRVHSTPDVNLCNLAAEVVDGMLHLIGVSLVIGAIDRDGALQNEHLQALWIGLLVL